MSTGGKRIYVFDTSALIAAWVEQYPLEHFPTFWDRLNGLVTVGRLITPREVLDELGKQDDDLHTWLKDREAEAVTELTESVQKHTSTVLGRFPFLTKSGGTRGRADPFVVALALDRGGTVVTKEGRGSDAKPKIPNACDGFGVDCFTLVRVIREENWRFK